MSSAESDNWQISRQISTDKQTMRNHNLSLSVALLVLCTIGCTSAAKFDDPDVSDEVVKDLPGAVDDHLIALYDKFKKQIMGNGAADEQLLEMGRNLVDRLSPLGDNGNNLKATILLMHTHDWFSLAYLKAKLWVESAIENKSFELLCRRNRSYCSMIQPIRALKGIKNFRAQFENWGVMGIGSINEKSSAQKLVAEIEEAYAKYKLMLVPEKVGEGNLRHLYRSLLRDVEKAHKDLVDYMSIFIRREQKAKY